MQIQLLQHLDNSSQLSPFQCAGLRKNHSTQDAVSYFTDCFRKGIACFRRLGSGEQVKSYAASAKRNRALIFRPLPVFARSPPSERLEQARKGSDEGCVTADGVCQLSKSLHQCKSPTYPKEIAWVWYQNPSV